MKKLCAFLLVVLMLVMLFPTMTATSNVTLVTTTVPDSSYRLQIPATVSAAYGYNHTSFDSPRVSQATGFSETKNLEITMTWDNFVHTTSGSTLAYTVDAWSDSQNDFVELGQNYVFKYEGQSDGSLSESAVFAEESTDSNKVYFNQLGIGVTPEGWRNAEPGDYIGKITFVAAVAEE